VAGPGDQQVKLDIPVCQSNNSLILLPPTVTIEHFQLIFRFYDGQGLPDLDIGGGCDAYISTNYMDFNARTKVKTTKKNCVTWNEEMWLAVRKPTLGSLISFSVYDKDLAFDDYIGSMEFRLSYLEGKARKVTRWVNMYGATPDSKNTFYKRLYDQNPRIASSWNGRILVQLESLDTKNPKQKCVAATNFNDKEVVDALKLKKYYVNLMVGEGICFPEKNTNLAVEIKIAEISFKTDKKPLNVGRCYSWNWKIAADTVIQLPYSSMKEIPDIFIYIRDGKQYISFKRVAAKNYKDPNMELEWLSLDENLSDGTLKRKNDCGIVSWKFSISDSPNTGASEETKGWKVTRPVQTFYDIFVHIFQCKDLPAADEEGTSDTYIRVVTSSETPVRTNIAYATLNPVTLLSRGRFGIPRSKQ